MVKAKKNVRGFVALLPFRLRQRPLSPAEYAGLAALGAATALACHNAFWAISPLLAFVLSCLLAPFFARCSFFFPVLSRGDQTQARISITFDDGPHPQSTGPLLALLAQYAFPAAFFVNGERVRQYPALVHDIIIQGHEMGNHSHTHDNMLMFRGSRRIIWEIEQTNAALRQFGRQSRWFRPPVGIISPRYADALFITGMRAVNFSVRGRDMGNRRFTGLAGRMLGAIGPGDIVLLHDAPPPGGSQAELQRWLAELEALFSGIRKKGLRVVPLGELLERAE